jgi:hypothetical protein
VNSGWWWYREYASGDLELEKLEKEARNVKNGLWDDPKPVPQRVTEEEIMLGGRRHFLALARAFVARSAPESCGKINPVGGVIHKPSSLDPKP